MLHSSFANIKSYTNVFITLRRFSADAYRARKGKKLNYEHFQTILEFLQYASSVQPENTNRYETGLQ